MARPLGRAVGCHMRLVNRRTEGGGGGRRRAEQGQGSRGGPIELGLERGEQDREWPRHTGKMRTVERPSESDTAWSSPLDVCARSRKTSRVQRLLPLSS